MALNSNNYVRFFRLVKSTSYLNACLLHRYFSEVRVKALHTILKAYCVPNRSEQFPLSELVQVLAFENASDVQNFCDALGLKSDGTCVILNRGNFVMPESSIPAPRAFQLIENKRTVSVGELINGGPLPENPILSYQPHDSFDKEGNLRNEAYDASDQAKKCMAVQPVEETSNLASQDTDSSKTLERAPIAEKMISLVTSLQSSTNEHIVLQPEPTVAYSEAVPHQANFHAQALSEETIQDIVEGLVVEVINANVKENIEREIFLGETSNKVFHHVVEDSCKIFIREIASEVLSEEAKINLLKAKEKERQLIEAHYLELVEETLAEEVESITRNIYNLEIMDWLNTTSEQIWNSVLHETLSTELSAIANEVYIKENESMKAALKKIQERRELGLCHKAFSRWKQFYIRRRHLDYARRTFPSAPPLIKYYKKFKKQTKVLKFIRGLQTRENITDAEVDYCMLENSKMWKPLDITRVLWDSFTKKYPILHSLLCFKLLLILPVDETDHSLLLKEWLAAKFRHKYTILDKDQFKVERLSLYISKAEDGHQMLVSINCIDKFVEDSLKRDLIESRSLLGTNAFMLVISKSDDTQFQHSIENERQRLEELLLCRPFYPPISLHIFITQYKKTGDFTEELETVIAEGLHLSFLKRNNFICDWKISFLTSVYKSDADQQVLAAVKNLSEMVPVIPRLTSLYLKGFMEDQITKFVFNPVFNNFSECCHRGIYCHQHPRMIIDLYNHAIEHMIAVASSNITEQFSWPLPEVYEVSTDKEYPPLHWNSPNTLRRLEKKMRSIQLPSFPDSFDAECQSDMWKYIALITSNCRGENVVLRSEITHLLTKYQNTNDDNLCWAAVLQACSFFILDMTDFVDETTGNEWKIYYFEEDLECFQFPEEWIVATSQQFTTPEKSIVKEKILDEEYKLPSKKPRLSIESASVSLTPFLVPNDMEEKFDQLSAEIEEERRRSKSFTQLLEKLLEEGDIINNDFPTMNEEPISSLSPNYEDGNCLKDEDFEAEVKTIMSNLKAEQTSSRLHTMRLNLAYQDGIIDEMFGFST